MIAVSSIIYANLININDLSFYQPIFSKNLTVSCLEENLRYVAIKHNHSLFAFKSSLFSTRTFNVWKLNVKNVKYELPSKSSYAILCEATCTEYRWQQRFHLFYTGEGSLQVAMTLPILVWQLGKIYILGGVFTICCSSKRHL